MASICTRCALRLRRKGIGSLPSSTSTRSFTSTQSSRNKVLPAFEPTTNPELDALLHDFRYKHFLPATLDRGHWNLVFRQKNKTIMEENPPKVDIGGEEIQLEHLGGVGVMPNRKKQLQHVMRILRQGNGEKEDWEILPSLLKGLHLMGKDPPSRVRAKLVRLAVMKGQFAIVLRCLAGAESNGFTLLDDQTRHQVIWGLRTVADMGKWSEEATGEAIKFSSEIATHLESNAHRVGEYAKPNDPRRSPFILGVFLELAAVYAFRFRSGEDVDGKVRALTERLLFNISDSQKTITESIPEVGPIMPVHHYAPVLHGLRLADRILGEGMPEKAKAREIIESYGKTLDTMKTELEGMQGTNQEYRNEALRVLRQSNAE